MNDELTQGQEPTEEQQIASVLAETSGQGEQEAPTQQEAPAWNGEEWAFETGGKRIVPQSRDDILGWANRGYNYSQRMGELNKTHAQRMAEAEAKAKAAADLEAKYSPFHSVNEYATKNPQWWEHVQQSYEQRLAQDKGIDPNLAQILNPLQEKLSRLEQEALQRQQLEEQTKLAAHEKQEDEALDADIQATRKLPEFANIAWDAKDAEGQTLELRVLKHGIENKISSYRAAARDYLHPQLLNQQSADSRQKAVQEKQAQAKAGILGKTPAPVKELKAPNTKLPWNHEQYSSEYILKQLGIGG